VATGEELKQEGQERALSDQEEWVRDAKRAVTLFLSWGVPFTMEEVAEYVAVSSGGDMRPRNPSSWGALTSSLAHAGIIHCVGYATAKRRSRHAALIRVWSGGVR
jgi:hypothetical protein